MRGRKLLRQGDRMKGELPTYSPFSLAYHATKGFMLPQSRKGLYRQAIGSLFSEIGQEGQDVAHRNHAD
jgi:hypothetical protein